MLLTFRRRKDKARDDIKIFFFFSLLLLIEMMIAAVLSLLLLLSLSLSVCENNNIECVSFVFCCCLTSFTVWESSKVRFSSSLFWVSLKIKGKKTHQVLFFSFFFLSFLLRLSGATRRRRESYPRLLHLKYITSKRSPYAQHFHNT